MRHRDGWLLDWPVDVKSLRLSGCYFFVRNSHGPREDKVEKEVATPFAMPRLITKRCHFLLVKLMEHHHGWLFNAPVDVKGLRAIGYYNVVINPMDLGTVKCRLEKGRYSNPIEFSEDVRLTFHNAKKYNNRGDAAYNMAEELLEIFTVEWSILEADFAPLLNNIERIENPSAGATSRINKGKGKGKDIASVRDLRDTDEKYGSWRKIFSEEFLPVAEYEVTQIEHHGVAESSAKSDDEAEVHQLKGMLAASQEKLASLESENESLRKTMERLQKKSDNSLKFWEVTNKYMLNLIKRQGSK
ncbi:uncharacterized protein LOC144567915 isoform X2 [Carex rostrata]